MKFSELSKSDLEMMVVSMRKADLAQNTISSYIRTMNVFFHWCSGEGYTNLTLPKVKDVETVKETYTDEELELLLRRPAADCSFCEYRSWVIVNFPKGRKKERICVVRGLKTWISYDMIKVLHKSIKLLTERRFTFGKNAHSALRSSVGDKDLCSNNKRSYAFFGV